MAPKLYAALISPPTRAVLMCAKALGVDLELIVVDLVAGEQLKEDFLKINPGHTVPVLEDDDGFIVIDSHAINGYLVAKYGKDDSLYPKSCKLRAIIDHRLHFDSSFSFVRGLNISKPLVFGDGVQPDEIKIEALKEAFFVIDKMLQQSQSIYIAGTELSIADFSFVTTVTQWDIFVPYADFPCLKAYIERMQKLPVCEINNEGLVQYNEMIVAALKP